MKRNIIQRLFFFLTGLYIITCTLIYFFQERLLFFPKIVEQNVILSNNDHAEELKITVETDIELSAVLLKNEAPKGLILFSQRNGGSVRNWSKNASIYIGLGYDICYWDYRGYGKSSGQIDSEEQLFLDAQCVLDTLINRGYNNDDLILMGYSLGTGVAAYLAANNTNHKLALLAPYYNMKDLMEERYPFLPTFLLRYPLMTNEYIEQNKSKEIHLFHGLSDELIYHNSTTKLYLKNFKKTKVHFLDNVGHNDIEQDQTYQEHLKQVLSN